ncbi:tRNA (N6-isopentenyl adenosine(37)-C2)-methylthiotransferase MiaB [Oligosphaera ethanolica]|jgi:tRNA-2-methylthio-N6-dimethylallyladenosine synthase|uniref:tRNA-2-methylthio-N(6)-dimethylallyladenosine synthase n=1 Tax=Oligosphaera ethanolica TaxID=760260 RepID=A0AAE4AMY0_9BACT|nr:tRNA (N6-isopentenyl adenosine(37)-C2)-methylthiotransferase MiaB [Oligosphaera ethanolica]MDQ0289749.1 tRNA-2-methylthio-N6-dimethylallyladenosine synthase [Oligosphaera ethanolica]NLE55981.1 tRNA (N6-isopentenyl adenosine(37)-C2)-methylthiotransferase MiaB [Lentisphaerota bacterium]
MSTFHIKTYGCQMNERDSEALSCLLENSGHQAVASEEEADIIIFNTCSVRDQAERKVVGKLGILRRLKRDKPGLILGLVGCMAQNHGDALLKELPQLDFVTGTDRLHTVPDSIRRIQQRQGRSAEIAMGPDQFVELTGHHPGQICAFVSVMRGCDQFCSYCIVPHTRGREKSRPQQDIVDEVRRLVDNGTREILLLGQNITAYGIAETRHDDSYRPDYSPFADLLAALNDIPGLVRIRFTSPHVRFMNDHFIDAICSLPKVCKAFHVPVQAGSNRILKLMRRSYTAEEYRERIAAIRSRLPEQAFSTDVIVGFPTESDDDFAQTRDLMAQVDFDMAYIFRYSPRSGTKAAKDYPDDVPDEVKHQRNQILLDDLAAGSARRNERFRGRVLDVLVEGVSKRNAERWTGRTDLNKVCNFVPVPGIKPGDLVKVTITRTTANSLFGEAVMGS